jgi:hypothetical protein
MSEFLFRHSKSDGKLSSLPSARRVAKLRYRKPIYSEQPEVVLLDPGAVAFEHMLIREVSQLLSHPVPNNTYHSGLDGSVAG